MSHHDHHRDARRDTPASTDRPASPAPNYAPLDSAWDVDTGPSRSGRYAGVGPRSYRRSDARIAEDINDALTRHPDLDATDIDVACENGDVLLTGTVRSWACKHAAEDTAQSRAGVRDVRNQLRIERERENADQTRGIDDVAALGMKDAGETPNY